MVICRLRARYLPRIRRRDNSQPKKWQFFLWFRRSPPASIPLAPNIPDNPPEEANTSFSADTLDLHRKSLKHDVEPTRENTAKFFCSYEYVQRFWGYEHAIDRRLLLFFSSRPP